MSLLTSVLSKVVTRLVASASLGKGAGDIVLSCDGDAIVFPVVPADLPKVSNPQDTSTFNGVNCNLSVIGNISLKEVKLDGLMPINPSKYSFCRPTASTAYEIIAFMEKYRKARKTFRLVIVFNDGSTYVNMSCIIPNFEYYKDNVGDYHYSVDFIEHPTVGALGQVHS